jgi:hypothetical protein
MNGRAVRQSFVCALAVVAAGCVGRERGLLQDSRERRDPWADAQLLKETVTGNWLRISGVVEVGSTRVKLETDPSGCRARNGSLHTPALATPRVAFENCVYGGGDAADQLFTELCRAGMPDVVRSEQAYRERWQRLTPEQRQREVDSANAAVMMMLEQQQRASEGRRRDARDRELMDAIRSANKPRPTQTDCYTIGNTVHCDTR